MYKKYDNLYRKYWGGSPPLENILGGGSPPPPTPPVLAPLCVCVCVRVRIDIATYGNVFAERMYTI